MATTSQLLTWIELEVHGWNREGPRGTRALFNEAHKMLLQQEAEQNILYDTSIGNLPFLSTTSNVFTYNVPAIGGSNYWLIKAVLIDSDTTLDDQNWRLEDYYISGMEYRRVLNVKTIERGQGVTLRVLFTGVNPGTTTEIFRILGYRRPVEILSDSIQHEMPGTTDIDFLYPATIMLIRSINDDKKLVESKVYIEKELKPKVMKELNKGEQGDSEFCVKRAF